MKLRVIGMLLFVALGSCTSVSLQSEPTTDNVTIRTGTSFGMCIGYCIFDYEFSGTLVTLTQTEASRNPRNLAKTCQFTISSDDWNTLKTAAANVDAFSKQPERIGCPDCADGGAEYIELQVGDKKHRVTFEYGSGTIPGFESLVEALRTQRKALKECK